MNIIQRTLVFSNLQMKFCSFDLLSKAEDTIASELGFDKTEVAFNKVWARTETTGNTVKTVTSPVKFLGYETVSVTGKVVVDNDEELV